MEKWRTLASLEDAIAAGLSEKEFSHIREILGRDPSVLEMGIFAALYSEHCSYKSSKLHLKTLPSEGARVLVGPGENAGVIDIGDDDVVVFKVESHNHPSFIDPFQGAATGVGGILRDVFTMGARPVALLNAMRFGTIDSAKTKSLLAGCSAGVASYANAVGVPVVGGELFFHDAFAGNCLVNVFALGFAKKTKLCLARASGPGNLVVYVGAKTGRDGIHGATMASKDMAAGVAGDDFEVKRTSVQVANPQQGKPLIEACLEAIGSDLVVGMQDMGAAGMTCACYEMAARADCGMRVELDKLPQREEQLTPYEIMLSESQERMLLVVEAAKKDQLLEVFKRWGVEAAVVGEVIAGQDVELFWQGELVSAMSAPLLTNAGPQYRWPEEKPAEIDSKLTVQLADFPEPEDLGAFWLKFLAAPNVGSRYDIYKQYDASSGGDTVVGPGGDAAVVRVRTTKKYTAKRAPREKGVAMTLECNSRYCAVDPRQGVALAVAEACRNLAAVGASPIGISDCLNFGSPERPESMWQVAESIRGLAEAARAFGVPVVSGNVSLYNETRGKAILPTPLVAMVGLVEDVRKCVNIHFKEAGDIIFVIGETREDELGASEYLSYYRQVDRGDLPLLDYDLEIKTADLMRDMIDRHLIVSCHDISAGGLAVALAECCFRKDDCIGATIKREPSPALRPALGKKSYSSPTGLMFSESGARYIVSCKPENEEALRRLVARRKLSLAMAGRVGGDDICIVDCAKINAAQAYESWKSTFSFLST